MAASSKHRRLLSFQISSEGDATARRKLYGLSTRLEGILVVAMKRLAGGKPLIKRQLSVTGVKKIKPSRAS